MLLPGEPGANASNSSLSVAMSDVINKQLSTSPIDGKLGIDLAYAIQHHLPLTVLQKAFMVVLVTIPCPATWKFAFFNYLYAVNWHQTGSLVSLVIVLLVVLQLLRWLIRAWIAKREPLVFLELTFPSTTNKTAHATEQFFTLLHTLAGQRHFIHQLFGHTKRYSLELVATRENGIRYILVASKSDASIIERSLLSYLPGIKIRRCEDYLLNPRRQKPRIRSRIIELQQAGDFAFPLQTQKLLEEHDPIAYLAGNMTKLGLTELMAFQVIATPVSKSNYGSVTKHMTKLLRRIYRNQPLASAVLATPIDRLLGVISNLASFCIQATTTLVDITVCAIVPGHTWDPSKNKVQPQIIVNPIETQLQTDIKSKIDQPLFVASLRLLVQSNDPVMAQQRMTGFIATFGPLTSTYQSLVQKTGLALIDWRSRLKRFRSRRLSWLRNPVLTPSEFTDIYHFPYTETTKTEDLSKIKNSELPAPLPYKQTATKFDNVFATNTYGGSDTAIGLTLDERRRHTYLLGATGSGKTTLLSTMIYQDICNGKGVAVIDPHGQLVEQLLRVIPNDRMKDVVWFAPDDDGFPIALNLLELPKAGATKFTSSQLQKQKSLVASSINSIFQKFYDAKYFGPRMEYVLRNAILTALETENPTLLTILDILTKKGYRQAVVQNMPEGVIKDFWLNEFEKLGSLQRNQVIAPITNKIGGLLSSPINYNILRQPKGKLDFDEVMQDGKILLCDLSKGKLGEDESSFFGSLVVAKLQLAALRRALIPEAERKDFYLYVDEFQNFATTAFAELVSEARKYRLCTILAHQSISQIENRDIIKVILANVGTVICFRTANPEDEQFILPIFSPEVSKHEISSLPLYHFYMKVSVGQAQDTFLAQVNNFTVEGSDETAQAVIDASRAQFATPINLHSSPSQPTYQPDELHTNYVAPSGSEDKILFPLSLTGTEYGRDWKEGKSRLTSKYNNLTQIHYDILTLLYRYRFLNRSQLQHFLQLKNSTNLNTWLLSLINNNYLTRSTTIHTSGKQPAIYALNVNGIHVLKAVSNIDPVVLRKFYREHERSKAFIQRCLTLADINLDLRNKVTKTIQYGMYLASDYPVLSPNKSLIELAPHAFVIRQQGDTTEQLFIEIVSDLPLPHLRKQLKRHVGYFDTNVWQVATNMPFPTVLIVCDTSKLITTTKRVLKPLLNELGSNRPSVRLTTRENVLKYGLGREGWEELA